jgi:hypothetical protein
MTDFTTVIYREHLSEASFIYEQRLALLDDSNSPGRTLAISKALRGAHRQAGGGRRFNGGLQTTGQRRRRDCTQRWRVLPAEQLVGFETIEAIDPEDTKSCKPSATPSIMNCRKRGKMILSVC